LDTLNLIYVSKIGLGVLAAVICILLGVDNILSGIGIALLVYFVSDRLLKQIFIQKVEKLSTVTKTGIGIFLITWILAWILFFTFLHTPSA
jgi:ABC-type uncharacterized transport system permease subunit